MVTRFRVSLLKVSPRAGPLQAAGAVVIESWIGCSCVCHTPECLPPR